MTNEWKGVEGWKREPQCCCVIPLNSHTSLFSLRTPSFPLLVVAGTLSAFLSSSEDSFLHIVTRHTSWPMAQMQFLFHRGRPTCPSCRFCCFCQDHWRTPSIAMDYFFMKQNSASDSQTMSDAWCVERRQASTQHGQQDLEESWAVGRVVRFIDSLGLFGGGVVVRCLLFVACLLLVVRCLFCVVCCCVHTLRVARTFF